MTTQERSESEPGAKPVGQGEHVVRQGECMDKIAHQSGFFWETLWNLPENAELKGARKNPSVLLVGDRVTIPALRLREESISTEQRHTFRRKGVPSELKLQLLSGDEPRANLKYRLVVDGKESKGTTGQDGRIEPTPIPPDARSAQIYLSNPDNPEEEECIELSLGGMDPIDDVLGIQRRLENLGFECPTDGKLDEETRSALMRFQQSKELDPTGNADDETKQALLDAHGC